MHIIPKNIKDYKKIKVRIINFITINRRIIVPLLIIFFYIALYFLGDFSNQSLVAHDEGLYARRARLIEESDNWFIPPFSSPHHKTLGSYFFIALSKRLFGNSELALRLPSILSSFVCLICSYLIALEITNKKTALISLFALSTMPLWIQYSKYASPDIPFVLSILLVILFFLKSIISKYNEQYFYILLSGFFISISFFVRSYMALVPLIGLSPFILYHLYRKNYFSKIIFFTGILIGAVPIYLNLYFSYQRFGNTGFNALFDFAKKQAIGDISSSNLLLLPLNFLYFTFPTGIFFLLLFVFTKSNNKINHPLLIYIYPLLSFLILSFMSTSYPHYYLFLLPSLSILFAVYLTDNSFRFKVSRFGIVFFLFITVLIVASVLLLFIFNYNHLIIKYSNGNIFKLYIFSSILFFSYITSIRFIFDNKYQRFNLTKFFYNIVIPQYVSLSLLFNYGILGNPNNYLKLFLKDEAITSIVSSNTIYLLSVDSKIQTLLSYYLPSSKVINDVNEIRMNSYLITSDKVSFDKSDFNQVFKTIKKFDNHILLKKLGK